jgi:hypothetical protein
MALSGFSDNFYRVCMGRLLVANMVYERVYRTLQSMKDRYSEDSENCSKLPLWGDVQVGGTSGGLVSSDSRITLGC